ncbi:hypothetical protein WJX73_006220 [Symbiochloris irregularis]|uniref:Protein kinase domain-containing protein n=1 Tax=Symbiochloris irregularis TaxID=706552 RepID=A0AAW1Q069_9CHLO
MRDTLDEQPLEEPAAARDQSQSRDVQRGPFGYETTASGASIVESLGDGGVAADDFEVQQQLGQLSWVTEKPQENLLQLNRPASSARTAILLFLAHFFSRQAYQGVVKVLLKEYLPGATAVAVNEVQTMTHLQELPQSTWQAANAPVSAIQPYVPLLGHFRSAPSTQGRRLMAAMAEEDNNSKEQALWLVYKWEGLQPLSLYAAAAQPGPRPGLGRFGLPWGASKEDPEDTALRARCTMVRTIVQGSIAALAHCHDRDTVHGSLGAGSILLSTFDDTRSDSLIVKLDNFGFARQYSSVDPQADEHWPLFPAPLSVGMDSPSALGTREDLQALGLVVLELVFAALAEGKGATASALQRLLVDVFASDITAFRKYCLNESDWTIPCVLLDEFNGAGWQLVQDLMQGTRRARDLQQNAFCCL